MEVRAAWGLCVVAVCVCRVLGYGGDVWQNVYIAHQNMTVEAQDTHDSQHHTSTMAHSRVKEP